MNQMRDPMFADLAQKYRLGGGVRAFNRGGAEGQPLPEDQQPEAVSAAARPLILQPQQPTPVSPAAADLMGMLGRYASGESTYGPELAAARKRADAESEAFQQLLQRSVQGAAPPDKSELYFRLAAAFGAPTKTGSFAEGLSEANRALAEHAKESRAAQNAERQMRTQLAMEAQKMRMQGAREDVATLRTMAGEEMKDRRALLQEYLKSGRPQSEAGRAAVDAGLKQGTPEFTNFVNKYIDEKLTSGNLLKEAMVAISAGQLKLAQGREERQAESAKKLTPGEVKLKAESESALGGIDDALASLQRAYALNPNTFDGTLAAIAQRKLLEQTNPKDPRVVATREQENLLSKGAIDKLRASFGGNPTEGERAALLALEGIDAKSKDERAKIMRNTYGLLKARREREQKRLSDVSAGLYRETTPTPGGSE